MRRDDHGAISIIAAVGILAVLAAGALSVDVGRITLASRDLQAATDLAALDAVRALGDLRDPAQDPQTQAEALAAESLAANAGFSTRVGQRTATVEVGDLVAGEFVPWAGGPNPPTAVRVTTTTSVDQLFLPGSRTLVRTAIAQVDAVAGLSLASRLGSLSSRDSAVLDAVVGALLGGEVDVGLVGWQGLLTADVRLGDLAAALGSGTVSELAHATVDVADLFAAAATVLSGQDVAAAQAALGELSREAQIAGPYQVAVGDVLSVGVASGSAADVRVGVFDLVQAVVQAANQGHAVEADLPVQIPGVAGARLTLTVIEPPQIAVGPARLDADGQPVTGAHTGQVDARVTFEAPGAVQLPALPPLFGGATADLSLPVELELAGADAGLTGVVCRTPIDAGTVTVAASSRAASARIDATVVDVPGVLAASADAEVAVAPSTATLTFTGPWQPDNVQRFGATAVGAGLLDDLTIDVTVAGVPLPVGVVRDLIRGAVTPILASLDVEVIDPLARTLGARIGEAEVGVFHLDCRPRRLVR